MYDLALSQNIERAVLEGVSGLKKSSQTPPKLQFIKNNQKWSTTTIKMPATSAPTSTMETVFSTSTTKRRISRVGKEISSGRTSKT